MLRITIQQFVQSLRYKNAAAPTPAEVSRRQRFLAAYPAQEANIVSYQSNPGCKCAGDLMMAVNTDTRNKSEVISAILGESTELVAPIGMAGKVMIIDDTDTAWADLNTKFVKEMMTFRGLSIISGIDENGNRKLRVFFY